MQFQQTNIDDGDFKIEPSNLAEVLYNKGSGSKTEDFTGDEIVLKVVGIKTILLNFAIDVYNASKIKVVPELNDGTKIIHEV